MQPRDGETATHFRLVDSNWDTYMCVIKNARSCAPGVNARGGEVIFR